jgi:hypothetical protein
MRTMLKLWLLLVTLGLASQVRAQGPMVAGVAPVFGGDRVPVYEVHRALAGQPGDERSLGVGKWRSERALWSETASGVFAFLRCVSNGPHRGHLDIHAWSGRFSIRFGGPNLISTHRCCWVERERPG